MSKDRVFFMHYLHFTGMFIAWLDELHNTVPMHRF